MTEEQYYIFVRDHRDEIVQKVKDLDNFTDSDIAVVKRQIIRGINIRKKMPVVPFDEIKHLLVGYFAIKFIEDELGVEY